MNILPFIITWCVVVLVSADALTVWFKSNFIGELIQITRVTMWRNKSAEFWGADLDTRMRHEWDTWLAVRSTCGDIPAWFVRLITCPVCLGTHLVWLTAAAASCVLLFYSTDIVPTILFFVVTARSALSPALIISRLTQK